MLITEKLAEEITKIFDGVELKERTTSYKMVISKQVKDRDGETILLEGIDLKAYKKNPVVLLDHSYKVENIVGKTNKIYIEGNQLIADFVFIDTEKGIMAEKLYNAGMLKASSIGFIVRERDPNDFTQVTKAELLEWSLVAVPANSEALSLDGKDFEEAIQKGFIKTEIEEKIWDETENEYRYRIKEPNLFEENSFRTIQFQKSPLIRAIIGKLKGETSTTLQALRFPKDEWDKEKVNQWIKENKDSLKRIDDINIKASTTTHTLLFDKDKFTKEEALDWAKKHNYKYNTIRETENQWRIRQIPPEKFKQDSFKTIPLRDGVQAVIGVLIDPNDKSFTLEDLRDEIEEIKTLLINLADDKVKKEEVAKQEKDILEKKQTLQAIDNAVGEALKNLKLLKK